MFFCIWWRIWHTQHLCINIWRQSFQQTCFNNIWVRKVKSVSKLARGHTLNNKVWLNNYLIINLKPANQYLFIFVLAIHYLKCIRNINESNLGHVSWSKSARKKWGRAEKEEKVGEKKISDFPPPTVSTHTSKDIKCNLKVESVKERVKSMVLSSQFFQWPNLKRSALTSKRLL